MTLSEIERLILSILQFRNGTLKSVAKEAGLSLPKTQEILERLEVLDLVFQEDRKTYIHWVCTLQGKATNTL